MRTLRKRLSVSNRNEDTANKIAIHKVVKRYVEKMKSKGWELDQIFTGDSFLEYQAIVWLYKAKNHSRERKVS